MRRYQLVVAWRLCRTAVGVWSCCMPRQRSWLVVQRGIERIQSGEADCCTGGVEVMPVAAWVAAASVSSPRQPIAKPALLTSSPLPVKSSGIGLAVLFDASPQLGALIVCASLKAMEPVS